MLRGRHVLSRPDNRATGFQVNHCGGTRSKNLLRKSQEIRIWAYPKFLSWRAIHLAGGDNVVADTLSRQTTNPGHGRLHPRVVHQTWGLMGEAQVNLFASADALAHSWPKGLLYALPPVSWVRLSLKRTQEDRHFQLGLCPLRPALS